MWPVVTLIAQMTGRRAGPTSSGRHSLENSAAHRRSPGTARILWQHVVIVLGGLSKSALNSEPVRIIREGTRMRGLRPSRVNAQQ